MRFWYSYLATSTERHMGWLAAPVIDSSLEIAEKAAAEAPGSGLSAEAMLSSALELELTYRYNDTEKRTAMRLKLNGMSAFEYAGNSCFWPLLPMICALICFVF